MFLVRLPTEFQSTLPVWGATSSRSEALALDWISIHAPRVGSDTTGLVTVWRNLNFNPRSPCGERPSWPDPIAWSMSFQSTLPVWGATIVIVRFSSPGLFQSTLPVWGATDGSSFISSRVKISIHAPRVGSDGTQIHLASAVEISIHAPRVGSDVGRLDRAVALDISIHAPRVGSDSGHSLRGSMVT